MKRQTGRKHATMAVALFLCLLVVLLPVTHAASIILTYDANGNLVTGDGKYRTYNDQNQLVRLYNGSNTSGTLLQEYAYHPSEERILWKKTYNATGSLIETVVYVNEEFVQITNTSGTYNYTYLHANGQQIAQVLPDNSKQFLLGDIEGSARVTTNSSGEVIERTSYTPYGSIIGGGMASRFNYEARENDLTAGDTDFRFRKYNSNWGVFTQPDNVIQDMYNPQSFNRYSFERNNPAKYKDPSGHLVDTLIDIAFIGIDIKDIIENPKNGWNYLFLTLDVGFALIPLATGGGLIARKVVSETAENGPRIIEHVDSAVSKVDEVVHVVDPVITSSFDVSKLLGHEISGFAPDLLARHFADHGAEVGARTAAEYEQKAIIFLEMTEGKNVRVYERTASGYEGELVKYSYETNEFAVVTAEGRIKTYFKPEKEAEYYFDDYIKYGGVDRTPGR